MNEKKTSEVLINNLNTFMREMGISRNQLAKDTDVHPATLCRWLKGQREISFKYLDKLSLKIGINSTKLIDPKLKIKVEKRLVIT